MDLGSVLSVVSNKFVGKSENNESFLVVKISSQSVLASAWSVIEGKVVVGEIGSGEIKSDDWEGLLHGADQAVSKALVQSPAVKAKTIFAVAPGWVTQGKIIPEKLQSLRHLCKELDLSPQGFVLTSEALENYYKETEGAPLTAILIGVDGTNGSLTIYRAGRNFGTTKLELPTIDQVVPAVESALKNFTQTEVLPSRIIIHDGKSDLEGFAQKITAYPWTKHLPFLHFPKVEIVPAEEIVKAVAVAGGVQIGGKFEVEAPLEEVSLEKAGFEATPNSAKTSFGQIQEMSPLVEPELEKPEPLLASFPIKFGSMVKDNLLKLTPFFKFFKKGQGALILALLIFLLLATVASAYFLPQTTLIVKISPKTFTKEAEIIVVTDNAKSSSSSAIIVGTFIDVSEIGAKKGVASGKKLVGDKAKGTVTIYGASSARTFSQGTVLTSIDGIKFTLDHGAVIASASDFLSPATISTTLTASGIGDSYNLPAGTKFTISGLSSSQYLAKNDSSFTGGNSHQATVVTKEDQDRLYATLSAELNSKAIGDLEVKITPVQSLLPNAMTQTVSKKKFSRDIDTEADTVSLDLTIDYRGIVFAKEDLISIFVQKFASDIPPGFVFSDSSARVTVKSAKNDKSANSVLQIQLSGLLVPAIDKSDLVNKISGKSLISATQIINKLPSVSQVTISTKPRMFEPITKMFLPWKKENIKVDIVTD